ncbi:hypothetical protein ACEWES_06475 [Jeotgalibacillus sp. JSM ZJ347]
MFIFNALVFITGITILIGLVGFMTLRIIQSKKTVYSWVILSVLIVILLIALRQALIFFNFI